jgi:hypothetical protein
MEATMKAWRALENGGLELLDLPTPKPAADGIVVRMQAAPMLSYLRQVREALPLTVGEMLAQDWTVMGVFMYPKDVPARLAKLIADGLLDLGLVRERCFPLAEIEAAMNAAAKMRGLDLVALTMERAQA